MWPRLIRAVSDQLPQMNHDLFMNFHKNQLDCLVDSLEDMFKHTVKVISNNMGWEENVFRYVGRRELGPHERVAMLKAKNRKAYEKRYSIRKTYQRVLALKFCFRGEMIEMPVALPYLHEYAILKEGTPYYPTFAITDRGGLCYMRDSIVLQVRRARLTFKRAKVVEISTVEGFKFGECPITAKINQSKKAYKEPPPIILHHLAELGVSETFRWYNVEECIELTNKVVFDDQHVHVAIGNDCFIRVVKEKMTTHVKRVLVSLYNIYTFYKNFDYERIVDKRYYIIVTGKWCNVTLDYENHLYSNAQVFMNMNATLLDPKAKRDHRSIGLVYNDLNELMLFMFLNIDKLMADHGSNMVDMYKKRIAGTDMISLKLDEIINYRMFSVLNARHNKQVPDIRKLFYPLDFKKPISDINIFRRAPMLYGNNALAVIGLRFTTLSSIDINNSRGGRSTIPPELLVAHHSYLSTVSIMNYPSSKPIATGSLNGYISTDEYGNILEPYYIDELKTVYGQPN